MAKSVFGSHDQTAHVWAQADFSTNRTHDIRSSDGRVLAQGRVLYSYGTHFALGLIQVEPKEGGRPIRALLNSSGYSPSTGKHKGIAWGAVRHLSPVYVPDLTAIVRTLEQVTGESPRPLERDGWQRKEVAAHIAKNWANYTPEAAAHVWGLVGGTAKQAAAMVAKARKESERKAAAHAKAEAESIIRDAKALAKLTPAAMRDLFKVELGDSTYDAERRAERFTKRLRKAHKAASAAGLAKVKTALWAHLKAVQAYAFNPQAAANIARRVRSGRAAIKTLRQYWQNLAAPAPVALNSTQWGMVEQAARELEKLTLHRPSLERLDSVLNRLAAHASEQWELVRNAEYEAREAEAAARRAEREREAEATKAAWFAGDTSAHWRGNTPNRGAYLRAVGVERDAAGQITGGTLQTSLGADVPLTHALKAFRFLKLCREAGREWHANGKTVPVGHFRIETIRANGDFIAGCHFIEWEQVATVARALGVEGWQGDESAVVVREHA